MNLRERIARLWQKALVLIGVFGLVRFHLIVLLLGLLLVYQVAQFRDMLIAYGLDFPQDLKLDFARPTFGWTTFLLLTMMGLALVMWFTARVMLRFRFDKDDALAPARTRRCPSDRAEWPRLKWHLPRVLGAGIFIEFLLGIVSIWRTNRVEPVGLAIGISVALGLFGLFVIFRRKLFKLGKFEDHIGHSNLTAFSQLPKSTRLWYWGLLAANVVAMLLTVYAPHAVADLLGPAAVALLAAALFVVVGSTLVYWSNWFRVPVVTGTVLIVALFSFWNDNHLVRLHPGMSSTDFAVEQQPYTPPALAQHGLDNALVRWVDARRDAGPTLPLFIVATEGGGARAAYWTGAVLAELHDRSAPARRFGDYVFAISSVSGGTLGAATYAALLAEDGATRNTKPLLERSSAILGRDFLGPTLTTLLFPDLLQKFSPIPMFEDRAVTLEQSWERAWTRAEPGDRFASPMLDLWGGERKRVPLLFFNSTAVETGERLIYASVDLPATQTVFSEALVGRRVLGDGLPLSTAVHLTARFPYVSPAGLALRQDNDDDDLRQHWLRFVDGGYFENSGSLTAVELLAFVNARLDDLQETYDVRIQPYVIRITNGASDLRGQCDRDSPDRAQRLSSESKCSRFSWLHETKSPIIALLNARGAHARQAATALTDSVAPQRYRELALVHNGVTHPLGWMLSQTSQRDMLCQIRGYRADGCRFDGDVMPPDVLDELQDILNFLESARD